MGSKFKLKQIGGNQGLKKKESKLAVYTRRDTLSGFTITIPTKKNVDYYFALPLVACCNR